MARFVFIVHCFRFDALWHVIHRFCYICVLTNRFRMKKQIIIIIYDVLRMNFANHFSNRRENLEIIQYRGHSAATQRTNKKNTAQEISNIKFNNSSFAQVLELTKLCGTLWPVLWHTEYFLWFEI